MPKPELYWISGSPPAWRVMLAMVIKGIDFDSRRLDHGKGENKTTEYLHLNPKGQVPTVVYGESTVRESIAILGWLDRAFPERLIFGERAADAACVWQDLMLMEGDLRPVTTDIAQILLRDKTLERAEDLAHAIDHTSIQFDDLAQRLERAPFLGDDAPMAADIWLYPTIGWIERAAFLAKDKAPQEVVEIVSSRPALKDWRARMAALPGVTSTHPPHWNT